jgi:FixJ family two-component response regulator
MSKPVIFIVDDDRRCADALSALLQAHGFATRAFGSVDEFLGGHDAACAGCLILDVWLRGVTGIELQSLLAERDINRQIVFVTADSDIPTIVQAMRGGAVTVLRKPVRRAELLSAVDEALHRDALERQAQQEQAELLSRLASLTPREKEVLDLVGSGKVNKQIALELCAAEKTIKAHRGNIMRKLRVRNTAALLGLVTRVAAADSGTPRTDAALPKTPRSDASPGAATLLAALNGRARCESAHFEPIGLIDLAAEP